MYRFTGEFKELQGIQRTTGEFNELRKKNLLTAAVRPKAKIKRNGMRRREKDTGSGNREERRCHPELQPFGWQLSERVQ